MPPLYLLIDTNLISARSYGIDLDLEGSRALLEHYLKEAAPAPGPKPMEDALRQLEDRFLGVLLHAWPEPADPVVMTLRAQAQASLERLRRFRAAAR